MHVHFRRTAFNETPYKHKVLQSECFQVCRDTAYFELNYTNLYGILPEKQAVKELKVAYFSKPRAELLKLFKSIRNKCGSKCAYDSCEQKLAITHVSNARSSSDLNFLVETAHFPIAKVVHIPRFQLMDYCLQCFSWAGIFIGFSIVGTLSFSPSKSKESLASVKRKLLIIRLDINKLENSLFNKGYFRGRSTQAVPRLEYSNRKLLRRFFSALVVYIIVTFVLLLCQLSNVTSNFFLFETTWRFTYEMDYKVELPNTAICLSLEDLMNIHAGDLNESNYHSYMNTMDAKLSLTIGEMFSSTPDKEIMNKCRFRSWKQNHLKMFLHNSSACSAIFKFQKVFAGGKIRYAFKPHQPKVPLSLWHLAIKPVNPGAIYSLVLDFGRVNIRQWATDFEQRTFSHQLCDECENDAVPVVQFVRSETVASSLRHSMLENNWKSHLQTQLLQRERENNKPAFSW